VVIDQSLTWFVVHTLPLHEAMAAEEFKDLAMDCWLPRYRVTVVRRGRKVDTQAIFFASYLFVGLDRERHAKRWTEPLFDSRHVIDVLGSREPLEIPGHVLQALADRIAGIDETERARRRKEAALFEVGEMRRVLNGPFMSFFAEVQEVLSNGIVRADVSIFGRKTPVEFTPDQLDKPQAA
jgi:transcriptional antiterminator NusG